MIAAVVAISVGLYGGVSAWQLCGTPLLRRSARIILYFMALLAVVCHGLLLWLWIDHPQGQNLSLVNLCSMMLWLVAMIIAVGAWIWPIFSVSMLVAPLAILSIVCGEIFQQAAWLHTAMRPMLLCHVLLSMVTVSLFVLAGGQAVLLAMAHRGLKHSHSQFWLKRCPPIQTMETLLFRLIVWGFVALSCLLLSSVVFYHQVMWNIPVLWHKGIVAVLIWMMFAVLLLGRCLWGWRGRKALYVTLTGVLLLLLVYLGNQLLHVF